MHLLLLVAAAQAPSVETVEKGAGALERGGLYTICVVLLAVATYLYLAKERAQARMQADILALVREQVAVLTKQEIVSSKVELLMSRIADHMNTHPVCPYYKRDEP